MRIKGLLAAASLAIISATSVSAASFTFDFGGPSGNLGQSADFSDTTDSTSLTATAVNNALFRAPTIVRQGGALGVGAFFDDSQIDNFLGRDALVFDLKWARSLTSITLDDASRRDQWEIYASNDAAVLTCQGPGAFLCLTTNSDLLDTGSNDNAPVALDGDYRFLIATVPGEGLFGNDDYRVEGLAVSSVPVPAAGLLLGGALFGGVFAGRRKKA
ncbi:MAG: hypothetical protein AAGD04_15140 [Pseudomonadota bacterium]